MDAKLIIKKLSKYTAVTLICIALLGLLFRKTLYWQIPVAADNPYGLGDIIDLLFYFAVLGFSGLLILCSFAQAWFKDYKIALSLFLIAIITPTTFYLLHGLLRPGISN